MILFTKTFERLIYSGVMNGEVRESHKEDIYLAVAVLFYRDYHGRIIKWTQHTGFLTIAGMARVVERNHGNDSKRLGSKSSVFIAVWRNLIIGLHFYFYERKTKQMRACVIL